jgi:uncharacterized protein YgiM (DUF1202 family)
MLKRVAVFGFILVGWTGSALADVVLENAVIKLIERYYELSHKVQELSRRVERLERQLSAGKKEEGIEKWGIKEKYQTQARLRVRTCPRTSCRVAVVLEKGEVVSLLSRKGQWAYIETLDGVRGWVLSKHLQEYSY